MTSNDDTPNNQLHPSGATGGGPSADPTVAEPGKEVASMRSTRPVSIGDEHRAVTALRDIHRDPGHAAHWAALAPHQRLAFVIGRLLALPGCCEEHQEQSAEIMRGYLRRNLDPERDAVRRRALEILAAVAIVDDHPALASLAGGQPHGVS